MFALFVLVHDIKPHVCNCSLQRELYRNKLKLGSQASLYDRGIITASYYNGIIVAEVVERLGRTSLHTDASLTPSWAQKALHPFEL